MLVRNPAKRYEGIKLRLVGNLTNVFAGLFRFKLDGARGVHIGSFQ